MTAHDWPEIVTERRETIATRTAEGTKCTLIALRQAGWTTGPLPPWRDPLLGPAPAPRAREAGRGPGPAGQVADGHEPALFVIVSTRLGREITAASARAAGSPLPA